MAQTTVRDVMTVNPICLAPEATIQHAAWAMRDGDVGNVLVMAGDRLQGILTDRDLVIRGIADGADPAATTIGSICSGELVTTTPDQPLEQAITLMRDKAIRRLPVVDGEQPIGILSLGDLAIEREPQSALADISAAEPDR